MVITLIGLVALVTSVTSAFLPGIAVGAGLIALGLGLAFTNRTRQ